METNKTEKTVVLDPILNILFTIKKSLIKYKNDPKAVEILNELASSSIKIAVQHFYGDIHNK